VADWRHQAACLTEDPELFFPIGNTGPAVLQIDEAKAVCRRCDVIETCLRWALDTGQDAGVWGGLSEDERRALKRRMARMRKPEAMRAPRVCHTVAETRGAKWTPAGPLRAQVQELVALTGLSHRQVAQLTGTTKSWISQLLDEQRKNVHTAIAERVVEQIGRLLDIAHREEEQMEDREQVSA